MNELEQDPSTPDFPQPDGTTTAPEFNARMRELRTWAGLTYRQVESRAAANGEVLPHSTVATALRRDTLPRRELLDVYVRACGGSSDDAARWQAHRDWLAAGLRATSKQPGAGSNNMSPAEKALGAVNAHPQHNTEAATQLPERLHSSRLCRPRPVSTIIGVAVCMWLAVFLVQGPHPNRSDTYRFMMRTTRHTCLDTGARDASGNPVVVESPCQQNAPTEQFRTQRNLSGALRIESRDPSTHHDTWCLDIGSRNQLRPNKCTADSRNQRFEMEAVNGSYRIRPIYDDTCFGLVSAGPDKPRRMIALDCAHTPNQLFTPVPV